MLSAEDVIRRLRLIPLGFEGGYFRETSRSELQIDGRALSTSIFYLLAPDSMSLLHRLKSDEIYHFYLGDPVELLMLHPGGEGEVVRLGSDLAREQVQHRVPASSWQGSRLVEGGRFALMGTTMSPGFDLADFELGDRDELIGSHPAHSDLIQTLTPERIKTERLELAVGTVDLLHAALRDRDALGAGLRAHVAEGWPPPENDERYFRSVLDVLERTPAHRGWWLWYLIERSTRTVIGTAGFKGPPDEHGRVEVGYSLMESHQRKGLATEAVVALIAWARGRGATRIVAETLPALLPSIRLLEKLRFRRVPSSDPEIIRFEQDD